MDGVKYLVQRNDGDSTWGSMMTSRQLVDYIDMADCHNESYEIYDVSEMGKIKKLRYTGWQPGCVIEVADESGEIVISGYGTDH